MEKNNKVGLAVNIIVTIILLAVSAYLVSHFYDKGKEEGFHYDDDYGKLRYYPVAGV